MDKYISTLFQRGNNDGDVDIKTSTKTIKCHSFVIEHCTFFYKYESKSSLINLSKYNIHNVIILFECMYGKTSQSQDECLNCLDMEDIIEIFELTDYLKCMDFVKELKLSLADKFIKIIDNESLLKYLQVQLDNVIFREINDVLLRYFSGMILKNVDDKLINQSINIIKELNGSNLEIIMSNIIKNYRELNNKLNEQIIKNDLLTDKLFQIQNELTVLNKNQKPLIQGMEFNSNKKIDINNDSEYYENLDYDEYCNKYYDHNTIGRNLNYVYSDDPYNCVDYDCIDDDNYDKYDAIV